MFSYLDALLLSYLDASPVSYLSAQPLCCTAALFSYLLTGRNALSLPVLSGRSFSYLAVRLLLQLSGYQLIQLPDVRLHRCSAV